MMSCKLTMKAVSLKKYAKRLIRRDDVTRIAFAKVLKSSAEKRVKGITPDDS
jgi:hypothetical protein